MPVIGKLVALYRAEGIDICTGLGSHDFGNLPTVPFTRFIKDGSSMTEGLGIALQEIYLLENLFDVYRPRSVFIIGNSLGWSTLAMGLLLPQSRIVAMDAGFDANSLYGIDLTNRMAAAAGLKNVRAVKGVAPQDVGAVVDAELGGSVDFAFIDGMHTNEQVVLDYEAVARKAMTDAVYLFHDVRMFNLSAGLRRIEDSAGRKAQLLSATPSGMALLCDPARHQGLSEAVAAFAPGPAALALVEEEARRYGFVKYLKRRLKRSPVFIKGINAVRRMTVGKSSVPKPL